jgi:hypothetical protein
MIKRFIQECPERFQDALEVAINKASQEIRRIVKKETPNKWGVKKEEMKDFRLRRAMKKHGNFTAEAILRGQNVPLIKMANVSPRTPMVGKTSGGVSVIIAGQNVRFKHAFIAQMPNNHIGIFRRTGDKTKKGKDAITQLTTSAVTGMTASEKTDIPAKIAPMIQQTFEKHFHREAVAWLNVLGAK